jgi:hypothetical protein
MQLGTGAPGYTAWSAGTSTTPGSLGMSSGALVGVFDTMPHVAAPGTMADPEWFSGFIPCPDGHPVLRVRSDRPQSQALPLGAGEGQAAELYPSQGCLSVVLAAFDDWSDGVKWLRPFPSPATQLGAGIPATPFVNLPTWGPDLAQALDCGPVAVDLRAWSQGSRYMAVWLAPYWVGSRAPTNARKVVYVVDDGPSPVPGAIVPGSRGVTVSRPFATVDPTQWAGATRDNLVTVGGGVGTAGRIRVGVANGWLGILTGEVYGQCGPAVDAAVAVSVAAASATDYTSDVVTPGVGRAVWSAARVHLAVAGSGVTAAGPVIVSLCSA